MENTNIRIREDEIDKESLFSDRSSPRYRSRSSSRVSMEKYKRDDSEDKSFIMKNGCCRECMRAFSKTGKSCLCQVPKFERKYILSEKGCNFCGCHGCNPVDVRREKRREVKKKLREDKSILYKKQRLLDSDDEELRIFQHDVDEWNKKRLDLLNLLFNNFKSSPYYTGFGTPLRTSSYILGYQPSNKTDSDKSQRRYRNRNDRKRSD